MDIILDEFFKKLRLMFYKLTDSCDLSIVGDYPQFEYYYPTAISSAQVPQLWHNRFVEVNAPVPEYKLVKRAIGTDVLTTSSWWFKDMGIIINEKVVSIFKKMIIPEYKLFPVKVYKYKGLEAADKYYYFHSIIPKSLVKYSESVFFIKDSLNKIIDSRQFSDEREFIEYTRRNNLKTVVPSKLVLNDNYKNFDLFFIYHGYSDFIISDKMKQAIENASITGVEIKECPEIILP